MAQPKIFVSYSHANTRQKERLMVHLAPLKDTADLEIWTDTQIAGGEAWQPAIENALSNATLAIFLITADFLNSDFITRKEVPALLERREKEGLRLYPILAKPCAWQVTQWLREIQMRPIGAKPVWRSGGRYVEEELARVTVELKAILDIAIQTEKAATDEASRQRAEQERREKEKAVAEAIANTISVEDLVLKKPLKVMRPIKFKKRDGEDAAKAEEIYRQIVDDTAKNRTQREQVMQDLQNRILQVVSDVTVNKPKTADGGLNEMDNYIRQ